MSNQWTKPIPIEERFWAKVDRNGPNGCWLWTAHINETGYGKLKVSGRKGQMVRAHRFAYELLVGPIPEGLTLDHLCRNRKCVNPAHLEPVTMQTNILRGNGLAAQAARKTHCPKGHPYNLFNTHFYPERRRCKICRSNKGDGRKQGAALAAYAQVKGKPAPDWKAGP